MRCFNHEKSEAIGICSNCGRAVCPDCVIAEPLGLYCSIACAEKGHQATKIMNMNLRAATRIPRSGFKSAGLEMLVGATLLGFTQFPMLREASPILVIMGVLMLLYACLHFFAALRFRSENPS